jgi:sulfur carrier protein
MQVRFNGHNIAVPEAETLTIFLGNRSVQQETPGVAVAINDQIILRSQWTSRTLKDGDEIEIVHAVQGG